ncbi:MAG: type VII secretion-associated protein [Actinophytocola sp.]|uniref:type VII secretion-associated protein n=1 Tax=Actinophytocola sp. TaxID=1872138 RepID=UPI003D6C23B8
MTLRVAVDFGTSSTCIAISVRGREPQVVAVDGSPLMSSAVYAAPDGTLFVGQEADRQAAVDPSRYEPHPKRRIDETELLLGATVVRVREVIRAVLARAVGEARRVAGGAAIDLLVLTHPADWGGVRTRVLRQAANGLANHIVLVPEPVAAAVFHAATFPPADPAANGRPAIPGPANPRPANPTANPGPANLVPAANPGATATPRAGRALAVLDLGGGTVDVSVVRATAGRAPFQVLAARGDPTFGGADVDQLLLDHVGSVVSTTDETAWRTLIEGRELADRRRRRVIHQDIRGAKETLSRHTYTDIPMPPPFPDAHVTRLDLEQLVTKQLDRAAELTVNAIREAGLKPADLAGIFLVGGSSRIPLVSRLVHQRTGVVPTSLDQPETVVARGALRAVAEDEATRPVAPPRPPTPARGMPIPQPVGPAVSNRPPESRPPKPNRTALLLAAGAALVVAAVVTLVVALSGGDVDPQARPTSPSPPPSRVIAQYEYQFALPEGWLQTGGDPDRLRTELKPAGRESGDDRVLVEEQRLSFDSDADRARAVDRLRTEYEQAGEAFADFDDAASYAGRDVVRYRERLAEASVTWYIVFQGRTQVSVGCQAANGGGGQDTVAAACETVIRTLTVTG